MPITIFIALLFASPVAFASGDPRAVYFLSANALLLPLAASYVVFAKRALKSKLLAFIPLIIAGGVTLVIGELPGYVANAALFNTLFVLPGGLGLSMCLVILKKGP